MKEGTYVTLHGIGIRVDKFGGIEEGYWKDGELHGRGRQIGINGDGYYIGEFKGGRKDGKGVEYEDNGNKYEGGWKNNQKYGHGKYYTKGGDKYKGKWRSDYKGKGKIYYTNGTKYKGKWKADKND